MGGELQLCGAPIIDVKAWKRSCVYRGDFDVQKGNPFAPLHPVVQYFWAEVESWSVETRESLKGLPIIKPAWAPRTRLCDASYPDTSLARRRRAVDATAPSMRASSKTIG